MFARPQLPSENEAHPIRLTPMALNDSIRPANLLHKLERDVIVREGFDRRLERLRKVVLCLHAQLTYVPHTCVSVLYTNLCDAGLSCKLSPPKIARTTDFKLRTQEGGLAERIGFTSGDEHFFIDVCVNPWSQT